MRRRDFIMVVGGAVGWPLATRAQQRDKLPTIAFLGADDFSWRPRTSAFGQRLRELGWVEGRSVKIQYYWAQGRQERVVELAGHQATVISGISIRRLKFATRDPAPMNSDDIAAIRKLSAQWLVQS